MDQCDQEAALHLYGWEKAALTQKEAERLLFKCSLREQHYNLGITDTISSWLGMDLFWKKGVIQNRIAWGKHVNNNTSTTGHVTGDIIE